MRAQLAHQSARGCGGGAGAAGARAGHDGGLPAPPLSVLAVSLLELGFTPSLDSRCSCWDLQPPKPVSLRDAGFATPEVALGCGFSSARVWLCAEDL